MSNYGNDDEGVDSEDVTPVNRKLTSDIEDLLRANLESAKRIGVNSGERERREASRFRKFQQAIDALTAKLDIFGQHLGVLYTKDADDTAALKALSNRFDTLSGEKPVMKQWFLGRGQTLIALVVAIGAAWGVIVMYLKLPKDPGNESISALAVVLLGLVVTLAGVATALGKSLVEPAKKEDER